MCNRCLVAVVAVAALAMPAAAQSPQTFDALLTWVQFFSTRPLRLLFSSQWRRPKA
jgi:hypothetical protein